MTLFPKRSGEKYDAMKRTNPKLFDTQCKLCHKPRPANAGPKYKHKEPIHQDARGRPFPKKPPKRKKVLARINKQRVRIETRVKSMLYLAEKGCEICGERDPRKLEYDHIDPAKKRQTISRFITDGYTWASDSFRAEIRKCRILCANCHRVHTIEQQGYYSSDPVQRTLAQLAKKYKFRP